MRNLFPPWNFDGFAFMSDHWMVVCRLSYRFSPNRQSVHGNGGMEIAGWSDLPNKRTANSESPFISRTIRNSKAKVNRATVTYIPQEELWINCDFAGILQVQYELELPPPSPNERSSIFKQG
jgi:hypothetical protein